MARLLALANVVLWTAAVAALVNTHVRLDMLGWDLGVFRDASTLLLHHQPLYDFAAQTREHLEAFGRTFAVPYPYAYPPIFAIETVPLALIPQPVAFAIVALLSIAASALAARLTARRLSHVLWLSVSYPAVYGFFAGQLVFIALGLYALSLVSLTRGKPLTAGAVASLLAYKPQLLLLLPVLFLLLPGARRAFVGLCAGIAAQIGVCLVVAPRALLEFPSAVLRMSAYADTHFRAALSFTWRGFFALLLPHHLGAAHALATVAILASGGWLVLAMARARNDPPRAFAIAMLATLMCALHCAPYDWVLVALPAWLLIDRASITPLAGRVLVGLFVFGWGMLPVVDAELEAWGVAFHPAMPMLCGFTAWALKARRR